MLSSFSLNNYIWRIVRVASDDPVLEDRTGAMTVATTDPSNLTIYLSKDLFGDFRTKVLLHELGHAVMISYGMLNYLEQVIPDRRTRHKVEEWACNLIADHGAEIFRTAYRILGEDAWQYVPTEMAKFVS